MTTLEQTTSHDAVRDGIARGVAVIGPAGGAGCRASASSPRRQRARR